MYSLQTGIISSNQKSFGPTYDANALAYMDRVIALGGTLTTTEKNAVNTLTLALKSAGIYTKCDIILPILGANAASSKVNLIEPTNATTDWTYFGSPAFSALGIKGNGTDAAVRSNWKINNLVKSTNTDSHLAIYSKYYSGGSGTNRLNGTIDTNAGYIKMAASQAGGSSYGGMYTDSFGGKWAPSADSFEGLMYADTTSNTQRFFYNDILRGTSTSIPGTFTADSGVCLLTLYWSAYQFGVYTDRSPDEMRFFSIGAKLTDAEKTAYYNAVNTYQTTLGRNV